MKVPNRFRACLCMEPDYGAQQDQWLLQERLRQIRRLEEENARLKWRNYNLDAQLTQTFDILDSTADLDRAFSGAVGPSGGMAQRQPLGGERQNTPKERLDDLRNRPAPYTSRLPFSSKVSRKDAQGALGSRNIPQSMPSLDLPMKQAFRVPTSEEIESAGSKGSLPRMARRQLGLPIPVTYEQGRRSADAAVSPFRAAATSVAKFNDATTDKANLTHD